MGDADRAIGQAVRLFRLAQENHKHGKLISENDFKRQGFSDSLIGTFAERVDGGIQLIGAEKHFGWLAERVEAGRRGGKQTQAKRSKVKQAQPSPSPSPSFSSSCSPSKNKGQSSAFDSFWKGYPRKVKKGKAREAWNRLITKSKDAAQILLAVEKLIAQLKAEGTEKRFIPHPTTFLNSFEDYLDPEFGETDDFSHKPSSLDDLILTKPGAEK
jgi:hypothetical protein